MTRTGRFMLLTVLGLVSACGGGGSGTSGASSTPAGGSTPSGSSAATIDYALSLTGAAPISQHVVYAAGTASNPLTCAQFVGGSSFFPDIQGTYNGTKWRLSFDITPYMGPGAYTTTTTLPMDLELLAPDGSATEDYQAPYGQNGGIANFKIGTNPNGSGSLTLTNWLDMASGHTEGGTVTWTCKDS